MHSDGWKIKHTVAAGDKNTPPPKIKHEKNDRFGQCVTEEQQAITTKGIGSIIFGFGWIGILLFFGDVLAFSVTA